jgi:hypothetical protein
MMELFREARQRIARVSSECARRGKRRAVRHLLGACMTVPQTPQVRCATLE